MKPRIYADFQAANGCGCVPLTNRGTVTDLERFHIALCDGMPITLYTEDADEEGEQDLLLVDAIASFRSGDRKWIAEVDWSTVRSIGVDMDLELLPVPMSIGAIS